MIMEDEKSHSLPYANWRTRKAGDIAPVQTGRPENLPQTSSFIGHFVNGPEYYTQIKNMLPPKSEDAY